MVRCSWFSWVYLDQTSQNLEFNKNLRTKIKKVAFFEYISSTKEIPEPF